MQLVNHLIFNFLIENLFRRSTFWVSLSTRGLLYSPSGAIICISKIFLATSMHLMIDSWVCNCDSYTNFFSEIIRSIHKYLILLMHFFHDLGGWSFSRQDVYHFATAWLINFSQISKRLSALCTQSFWNMCDNCYLMLCRDTMCATEQILLVDSSLLLFIRAPKLSSLTQFTERSLLVVRRRNCCGPIYFYTMENYALINNLILRNSLYIKPIV